MCFDFLYNLVSETFLILRKIQWDIIIIIIITHDTICLALKFCAT